MYVGNIEKEDIITDVLVVLFYCIKHTFGILAFLSLVCGNLADLCHIYRKISQL